MSQTSKAQRALFSNYLLLERVTNHQVRREESPPPCYRILPSLPSSAAPTDSTGELKELKPSGASPPEHPPSSPKPPWKPRTSPGDALHPCITARPLHYFRIQIKITSRLGNSKFSAGSVEYMGRFQIDLSVAGKSLTFGTEQGTSEMYLRLRSCFFFFPL